MSRADRVWLLAGYAGLAGFFAIEGAIRRGGPAASLEAAIEDQGTTSGIVEAYAISAALPLLLARSPGRLPRLVQPAGVGLQAAGLGLRIWSMRKLGAAYSRTLRTHESQRVVDDGPYALVRHPGYLGSLLVWLGFALTTRRAQVVAAIASVTGRAYRRRIEAEEELLIRDLPGYDDYARRTRRLIPLLW